MVSPAGCLLAVQAPGRGEFRALLTPLPCCGSCVCCLYKLTLEGEGAGGASPRSLCSSSHLELPISTGTGMGISHGLSWLPWAAALPWPRAAGLLLGLTQPLWRAGKQPSPPFPGLRGLLFIFLEGNQAPCGAPPSLPASCLPLTPTSSLFHPTFPQGHPASANGPLAAMMKMDV